MTRNPWLATGTSGSVSGPRSRVVVASGRGCDLIADVVGQGQHRCCIPGESAVAEAQVHPFFFEFTQGGEYLDVAQEPRAGAFGEDGLHRDPGEVVGCLLEFCPTEREALPVAQVSEPGRFASGAKPFEIDAGGDEGGPYAVDAGEHGIVGQCRGRCGCGRGRSRRRNGGSRRAGTAATELVEHFSDHAGVFALGPPYEALTWCDGAH